MYSYHSSPEEKNKLLMTLAEYGIETTVDRTAKKDRIKQWIQSSIIEEDEEEKEIDKTFDEENLNLNNVIKNREEEFSEDDINITPLSSRVISNIR